MKQKLLVSELSNILGCSTPQAYRHLQSKGVSHFVENRKSFITHEEAKKALEINSKNKVFHFYTPKGGVGKTTISREFINCCYTYGLKVLGVDLDHQAQLTSSMGLLPEKCHSMSDILQKKISAKSAIKDISEGLSILPSNDSNTFIDDFLLNGRLSLNKLFKNTLKEIIDNYDIVVIDSPPSHSRIVVSANLFSDVIIIPIIPDDFSINSLINLIGKINEYSLEFDKKIDFKIFLNNYDARKSKSISVLSEIMANETLKNHLVLSTVKTSTEFIWARENKVSIFESTRKQSRKICEDIILLTNDLLGIENA